MEPDWPGKISQLGQVLCHLATPDMTMKVYHMHYAEEPRGPKLLFFTFIRTRPSTYKNKMDMAEHAFREKFRHLKKKIFDGIMKNFTLFPERLFNVFKNIFSLHIYFLVSPKSQSRHE
jgi:hypothetical protein